VKSNILIHTDSLITQRLLTFVVFLTFFLSSVFAQELVIETLGNTACQGVPCGVIGPKILINEIMVAPEVNDGSIFGMGPNGGRAEWFELYNPDACNPVDISCFIIGNSTVEGGAAFRLPPNSIVPPSGFAVVRGVAAPPVPAANLVSNGGNTIEIVVPPNMVPSSMCAAAGRFWLPNSGGWIAIYDPSGVPQDAIRWGLLNLPTLDGTPCLPPAGSCPTVQSLLSYNQIPLNRKSFATPVNFFGYIGSSARRLPDGGIWNGIGQPTLGQCNGPCYNSSIPTCTGTATVISAPGNPPYTYVWDDPQNQTTPHAIGLCVGSYTVTVTSSDGVVSSATIDIDWYSPPLTLNDANFCINSGVQTISGYSPIPTPQQTFSFTGSGVSGTQFNPNVSGLGSHTITFSLTDQSGCSNSINAVFTVHPVPVVSLTIPDSICISSPPVNVMVQPAGGILSGPGIVGNQFDPSIAGAGPHQIVYTYTDPYSCANPATTVVTKSITVIPLANPEFPSVPSYCAGDFIPELPTTSNQGILGSWSPSINNQQTTTYTFTPNANECSNPTTVSIVVSPITTPTFPIVPPYCAGDMIPDLPPTSINNISGTWSPAIDNTQTTVYSFTPDPGQCAVSVSNTIVVNPVLTPIFTPVEPICAGQILSPLPTQSLNAVNGTWSPALNNQQTTTYTFTPSPNQCAVSVTMQIAVVSGSLSLTCPTNQSFPCINLVSTPYANLTAFQNAGGSVSSATALLVPYSFNLLSEIGGNGSCNQIITRTYDFSNVCNQTATCNQLIFVNDNIPPTATAPPNIQVQCIDDVPLPNVNLLTGVSDNCSNPTITHLSDVIVGTCPTLVSRTYRVQDACGNFSDITQTITVLDTIPPSGFAPPINVQCIEDVPAPNTAVITNISDNCSVPTVTFIEDLISGSCPTIISRTYRIQDECGNFSDITQNISILDTIPPTAEAPAPMFFDCVQEVPLPNINLITNLSDNCNVPTVLHLNDVSSGTCPEIISRIYRVEDACGNFTDLIHLITVLDSIPPTGTAPANIVVYCPSDVPAPNTTSVTNVTDNCQVAEVTHYSDVSDGNNCNLEQITRTYRIADACGNETFVSHTITIDLLTPTATLSSTNPTTCQGNEGTITISNLYDQTSYIVSFNGQSIPAQSDASGQIVFTGMTQGVYDNFVVSYGSCSYCPQNLNQQIVLQDPPNPIISAGQDASICLGNSVYLEAQNPQGAALLWSNNIQDGSLVTPPVGVNTYTVTATLNNCISQSSVVIIVYDLPQVDAGPDLVVCAGTPIVLNATGAQSYYWDNNVIDGEPFYQLESFLSYNVIGVDSNGCFNQDQVNITLLQNPLPSFSPSRIESCEKPFSVSFHNTSTLDAVSCSWIFDNNTSFSGSCNEVEPVFETEGCFGALLELEYINGCKNSVYLDSVVCVRPVPRAQFFATPSFQEVNNDVFFFNASQGAIQYYWYFTEQTPPITEKDVVYKFENSGDYDVILVAVNEFGCADMAKQIIQVKNPVLLFVPNAFTPDGDMYNNEFKPVMAAGFDPYNYELIIFSRNGEILFVSKNPKVGWPGTYGGQPAPEGIYIWQIEVKDEKGIREIHRGHVSLLR
jgi:gliding motility-associated-like protein